MLNLVYHVTSRLYNQQNVKISVFSVPFLVCSHFLCASLIVIVEHFHDYFSRDFLSKAPEFYNFIYLIYFYLHKQTLYLEY